MSHRVGFSGPRANSLAALVPDLHTRVARAIQDCIVNFKEDLFNTNQFLRICIFLEFGVGALKKRCRKIEYFVKLYKIMKEVVAV